MRIRETLISVFFTFTRHKQHAVECCVDVS